MLLLLDWKWPLEIMNCALLWKPCTQFKAYDRSEMEEALLKLILPNNEMMVFLLSIMLTSVESMIAQNCCAKMLRRQQCTQTEREKEINVSCNHL